MPRLFTILTLAILTACGGGGSGGGGNTPTSLPPPVPAATISATAAGTLVLHPSIDTRYAVAMVTPVRISEAAGGTAEWGFARMSIFRRGVEIERTELGANDIRAAGYGRITASSNTLYNLVFRFNSDDFDRIDITLGFTDSRDSRQFTVSVRPAGFTDLNISLTPLSLPRSPIKL